MGDNEKWGEERNTKICISWDWKELLGWNKKYFSKLFMGCHLVKIADIIFNFEETFQTTYSIPHYIYSFFRVGIKSSSFMNYKSISWTHKPKIRKL